MPAFITHYLYGVDLYQNICSKDMKHLIKKHLGAYCLGLQGPDIFFYHPFSYMGPKSRNMGSIMHNHKVSDFFTAYLQYMNKLPARSRETAFVYLCGLIAHNTLDGCVHPYIYYRSKYNPYGELSGKYFFGMHGELETTIDAMLLKERKQMLPSMFCPAKTLHPTASEVSVIAPLLVKAINKTYYNAPIASSLHVKNAILCTKLATTLLHSKHGRRKEVIRSIELLLFHRTIVTTTINHDYMTDHYDAMNHKKLPWYNPWNPNLTSKETFEDLYQKAKQKYQTITPLLAEYCHKNTPTASQTTALLAAIGNISYHSGLDCTE